MPQRIHPLVQNTNDRNPIGGNAEVDHVLLNTAAAIARSNVITGWSRFRLLCQLGKSSSQHVDIPMGLLHVPFLSCISPDPFKINLSCRRKTILSHECSTFSA